MRRNHGEHPGSLHSGRSSNRVQPAIRSRKSEITIIYDVHLVLLCLMEILYYRRLLRKMYKSEIINIPVDQSCVEHCEQYMCECTVASRNVFSSTMKVNSLAGLCRVLVLSDSF